MSRVSTARRQRGVTTVEFAIIGAAFFVLVLGSLDVARLLFTWNTLGATAHRAARLAAVCPPNHAAIASLSGFGGDSGGFLLPDFTGANLQLSYLDADFGDTGGATNSSYVRASIVGYTFRLLGMPILDLISIDAPDFESTVPAESLGFTPPSGRGC